MIQDRLYSPSDCVFNEKNQTLGKGSTLFHGGLKRARVSNIRFCFSFGFPSHLRGRCCPYGRLAHEKATDVGDTLRRTVMDEGSL